MKPGKSLLKLVAAVVGFFSVSCRSQQNYSKFMTHDYFVCMFKIELSLLCYSNQPFCCISKRDDYNSQTKVIVQSRKDVCLLAEHRKHSAESKTHKKKRQSASTAYNFRATVRASVGCWHFDAWRELSLLPISTEKHAFIVVTEAKHSEKIVLFFLLSLAHITPVPWS